MTNEQLQYERWKQYPLEDADLAADLAAVEGKEDAIYDRFYKALEFGTAGLRGVLGAGTNRMNIYTVRQATQGLAEYILAQPAEKPSVAIAYDSRIKSDLFAREAAMVFAANGVHVYLYRELMPTPMLSFAIRELGCLSGVVVTASHNPSQYNGYKAYGDDGSQLGPEAADAVFRNIQKTDIFTGAKRLDFDAALAQGLIEYISEELIEQYIQAVLKVQINRDVAAKAGLKVVYTPLNGAGNKPVRRILREIGITDLVVVPEQENPDGNFPTCPYPNPEFRQALEKGLALCEKLGYDLLLATDPDSDRVGIAVAHKGGYQLLTGNQVGVLMLEYIARNKTEMGVMPKDPIAVKSIVSTKMYDAVAASYGIQVVNVLTGFKFIGEQISLLAERGEVNRFLMGYEESYGYLTGDFCRDKDAVNGSMIICEMASYYKLQGKTLVDVLEDLYEKYGIFYNDVSNFAFEGATGMDQMKQIMERLGANPPASLAGYRVVERTDYKQSVRVTDAGVEAVHLPKSSVLEYGLENGCTVIVRPSGTEPKMKVYYSINARTEAEVEQIHAALCAAVKELLGV